MSQESGGSIAVTLKRAVGRVADVNVMIRRPLRVGPLLSGRTPHEVARLAPLLFPICGVAHGVACARALDGALGRASSPMDEAARDLACLAEAAVSHVWQLGLSWSEAAGVPEDLVRLRSARQALSALQRAIREGIDGAGGLASVASAVTTLGDILDELTSVEPTLLRVVRDADRAAFGAGASLEIRPFDVRTAGVLLAADAGFAESPEVLGMPMDLSAFGRIHGTPAAHCVAEASGPGLLGRLAARWADARAGMLRLAEALQALERADTALKSRAPVGASAGSAETARGPLVYWVRASEAKVDDVRVVAPTDWTFHTHGAVRTALLGVEATDTLARDVGWFVLALDPCFPWTVAVRDA